MKKIVELVVKLDNLELDGVGHDAMALVENPAIELDFMYFSEDAPEAYVDNKGMEDMKKFLDDNRELMKKPGGGPAGDGGVDHGAQMQLLEEAGIDTEYPFGYCFQIAQFVFYALGGYEGPFDLMCIKGMEYQVDSNDFQSTHWYVQCKEDGRIIDLSAEQFDDILDIEDYYEDGRRANLGFPYYNVGEERVEFDNTVPSLMTLKLYSKWKEQYGELEGIERFYNACQYEELRASMQFNEQELPYNEKFVMPTGNESEDDFIGRCIPVLLDEGYESDQAVAICYKYWEDGKFAEIGPRGGIRKSPKAPKSGTPNRNPKGEGTSKGSAKDTRSAEVSKQAEASLQKKSDEFNEKYKDGLGYGTTVGMLKTVYQRGKGAYNSSHSPGVKSPEQWAQARVNAFLYLVKEGRPQNKGYKQDNDLLPAGHPKADKMSQQFELIVECDRCDHAWPLSTGGDQPYLCHECDHDNSPLELSKFESYSDYPESAKNAAQRALDYREANPNNTCGTRVGWARAGQLANGENISEETIARMASFARHLQYKDVPYSEGCGGLMVDAWGGQAGIEWASNKLKEIREDFEINVAAPAYVDESGKPKKREFAKELTELEMWYLAELEKCGQEYDPEEAIFINLQKDRFNTLTDFLKGISAIDTLTGTTRDAQEVYRYAGPRAERGFCRAMLSLNKVYTRQELAQLDDANPGFGAGGTDRYSIFQYKGGVNCTHYFEQLLMYKGEGGRPVFIAQGVARGGTEKDNAGKSNNAASPSPTGAVDNNASLRFSFNVDEEQRIVVGPAMVPNKMILRRNDSGMPYHVYFTEKTIKDIAEKVFEEEKQNLTNIEHQSEKNNKVNTLLESWIVQDPKMDKSTALGFDVPKGTWMVSYRINDDKTWQLVKEGKLKGFSVEGFYVEKAEAQRHAEETYNYVMSILNQIV